MSWGVVASLAVSGLGLYLPDYHLFLAAPFVGLAIAGMGFFWTDWAPRHTRAVVIAQVVIAAIQLVVWLLEHLTRSS